MARQDASRNNVIPFNRASDFDLSVKVPKYRPQTAEKRYDDGTAKSTAKHKKALKAFCDEDAEVSEDELKHHESFRNKKPSFLEKPNFSRANHADTGNFGDHEPGLQSKILDAPEISDMAFATQKQMKSNLPKLLDH